jgi:hypothetical protein
VSLWPVAAIQCLVCNRFEFPTDEERDDQRAFCKRLQADGWDIDGPDEEADDDGLWADVCGVQDEAHTRARAMRPRGGI